jgi:putative hemolysin
MLWYLLAIVLLLVLSAFFSGSEAALFSLTPGLREELKTGRPVSSRRIEALLGRPDRLLGTLLLGNLLVNTTASSLVALLLIKLAHASAASEALYLGLGGVAMTAVLLVFGEVTPKLAATRRPVPFARFCARPVNLARVLLAPFVALLLRVSARFAPREHEPATLSDEELHTMIEIGKERGVILGSEEEILVNLVDLDRRTVSEVMTPRIDIVALPEDATVREAIAACRSHGFSRLPVYRNTIDHITGTAYAKDLLGAPDERAPVEALARPVFLVPEVKRLPELLDELRRKGSHIAVVVDEFGQTAGLVTLEDLLEAVFGEISDEYDVAEELPYSKLDESSYLVDGEIDIATLNRLFRNSFRRLGHERLSSFIHDRLGRLPEEGDVLTLRNLEITVRETDGNKLEKVLVRRKA